MQHFHRSYCMFFRPKQETKHLICTLSKFILKGPFELLSSKLLYPFLFSTSQTFGLHNPFSCFKINSYRKVLNGRLALLLCIVLSNDTVVVIASVVTEMDNWNRVNWLVEKMYHWGLTNLMNKYVKLEVVSKRINFMLTAPHSILGHFLAVLLNHIISCLVFVFV